MSPRGLWLVVLFATIPALQGIATGTFVLRGQATETKCPGGTRSHQSDRIALPNSLTNEIWVTSQDDRAAWAGNITTASSDASGQVRFPTDAIQVSSTPGAAEPTWMRTRQPVNITMPKLAVYQQLEVAVNVSSLQLGASGSLIISLSSGASSPITASDYFVLALVYDLNST